MQKRVAYSFAVPQGSGAVGADFKPERASAPSLGGTCFANMRSVHDLQAACSIAPSDHQLMTDMLVASGKRRDVGNGNTSPRHAPKIIDGRVKARANTFSRGMTVRDRKEGRKGIIIKAQAGFTAKSKTPVHRVCDSNGDSWLAKETNLVIIG